MTSQNLLRRQVASEIRKRRLIFSTIILLSLLYLGANFFFGNVGFLKYLELRDKKVHLEKELRDIETRNEHLRSEVKMFNENPFYIEKHARENFGMAKPDELIFKYDR
ncbi:MAG TPA: septum formation initiator family protein [Thermodesulfovibrionales bacterium]|jgi:cell division protein FtsB|nr:septum formation initiator family protein [Thermodesulfovibrionales bacterium]